MRKIRAGRATGCKNFLYFFDDIRMFSSYIMFFSQIILYIIELIVAFLSL